MTLETVVDICDFSTPSSILVQDLRLPEGTKIVGSYVLNGDVVFQFTHPEVMGGASYLCEVRATQSVWVKQ